MGMLFGYAFNRYYVENYIASNSVQEQKHQGYWLKLSSVNDYL